MSKDFVVMALGCPAVLTEHYMEVGNTDKCSFILTMASIDHAGLRLQYCVIKGEVNSA